MISIYGHGISDIDRNTFTGILKHAEIEEHELRYIDLEYEDPNTDTNKCIVAVGIKAIKEVIKDLTNRKLYSVTQLVGKDCVDRPNTRFLYCFPMTFTEMVSTQEDKIVVWNKVLQFKDIYREWYPFNDALPELVTPDPEPAAIETTDASISTGGFVADVAEVDQIVEVETEEPLPVVTELATACGDIPIDIKETLNALFEHVNLSDAGLGKSLSKYEKFTLKTSSGDLNIYPTNRMPKDDSGFQICFKDLVTILKMGTQVDAGTIIFGEKDGTSVSN